MLPGWLASWYLLFTGGFSSLTGCPLDRAAWVASRHSNRLLTDRVVKERSSRNCNVFYGLALEITLWWLLIGGPGTHLQDYVSAWPWTWTLLYSLHPRCLACLTLVLVSYGSQLRSLSQGLCKRQGPCRTHWRLVTTKSKYLTKTLINEKGLPPVQHFSTLAEHSNHPEALMLGPYSTGILTELFWTRTAVMFKKHQRTLQVILTCSQG